MREILFRGKHGGNWFEGNLVMYNGKPVISRQVQDAPGTVGYEVNPETVCQFTGLTDKNGNKIWENDIVKTHYVNAKKDKHIETVVFHNGRFCAFQRIGGGKWYSDLFDGSAHFLQDESVYMDEIEVIGNIFDNPELMEGGAV